MQRVSAVLSVNQEKSIVSAWIPRLLVVLLFCIAMLGRTAVAQTGQQFVGHIADSSHAAIAGATVTVHNEGTGEDVIVKATKAGDYTVPYMKTGNYTITADMDGFKTISKTHIHLDTDQSSKIDFVLPVGDHTETVTVNSAGSQIELSKADRGEIIDAERITELPANGRNVIELFGLAPGTVNGHATGDTSIRPEDNVSNDLYANGAAVIGSGAAAQENIDGATNENASGSNAGQYLGYPPVPDSVAEFKVVLNPYDASYGRAGGSAVDITLKSGTNKIHGNLYEFARRPWLDAPTNSYNYQQDLYLQSSNKCAPFPGFQVPGCIAAGVPSAHKRDQFGAGADGPVYIPHIYDGRDKTFFTIQWEQIYEDVPDGGGSTFSVPNPAWLQGNFNTAQYVYTVQPNPAPPAKSQNMQSICVGQVTCYLPLGIYDATLPVAQNVTDPNDGLKKFQRQQFPGNNCGNTTTGVTITCLIPQSRINPIVSALAPIYNQIKPNYNAGPLSAPYQNNLYFQPIENDYAQNGLFKIDHNFGPRDRGSIRWEGFVRYLSESPNGLSTSNPGNTQLNNIQPKDNNFALEEIHTFSPNLILDNKLVQLNERQNRKYGTNQPGILSTLGFSSNYINNSFFTNLFPAIIVNDNPGAIALGPGNSSNNNPPNSNNIVHTLAYQPSFTLIHGRHSIRGGIDMRLQQFANPGGGAAGQSFKFDKNFTQQYVNGSSEATNFQSGSGVADLVLGYPTSAGITFSVSPFYSQHYYGIWAQDDWKATPKLTLNFGVRYDILPARTERHNKLNYGFNGTAINPVDSQLISHAGFSGPITGGTLLAGVSGNPRGAYATNWGNIQPRFGAAYAFSSKTSLRAGFGEMFINNEDTDSNSAFTSSATAFNTSLTDQQSGVTTFNTFPAPAKPGYGTTQDPFALGYVRPPFPIANTPNPSVQQQLTSAPYGKDISFDNPNYQIPSIWSFSASLEQLLTRHDVLDISYAGTKAYNVTEGVDLNHDPASWNAQCDITRGGNPQVCNGSSGPGKVLNPFYPTQAFAGSGASQVTGADIYEKMYPEFGKVTENDLNNIHTWYNSLQVTASHSVSHSLQFHFAYTWSKTFKAGQTIDVVNGVKGRSLSSSDIPNAITISSVYYLPVGRGRQFLGHTNRVVDALIGGWQISPLYQFQGGKPTANSNNWIYISPLAIKKKLLPIDATHNYTRYQYLNPCGAVSQDANVAGQLDYGPAYAAAGCTAPAAIQLPSFTIARNLIYSGVRTPAIHELDVSLAKNFSWDQKANLQLRVDAFNALNHLNFNGGPNTTYSSVDYGTIDRKGNGAYPNRELQLSGKITF